VDVAYVRRLFCQPGFTKIGARASRRREIARKGDDWKSGNVCCMRIKENVSYFKGNIPAK
jgi:hypothetical protein